MTRQEAEERRQARMDRPDETAPLAEAVIRTVSQPLLVLSEGLTIEMANPAFEKTFGQESPCIEGKRLLDLGNGRWNIPQLTERLEQVFVDGHDVVDLPLDHEFPEIGRRMLLLSARRVECATRDDCVLVTIDDMTERKRTQAQLKAGGEFAAKVLDASREAIVVLDSDLRVQCVNRTFYDTFRVGQDQVEGRSLYALGNGQWDIPRLRVLLEKVLPETEAFDDFEVEQDFEAIGRRLMLLNARKIDHTDSILLVIEDITERRKHRAALAESEQRFQRAMAIETVGVIFWDHDVRITDCNDAFLQMSGFSEREVIGLHWRDLTPPEFFAASERAVAELTADGLATPYVKQYIRKDGSRWWGLFAPRRLSDVEAVEFVLDITERVQAEEQRDLLLAELNHRVKNMFAVIRALAMQGNDGQSADEFRDTFLGRLNALVRTHNLVFESEWRRISFDELARNALEPYVAGMDSPITINGPEIKVAPRCALSLSLVLHELATNASKYGALSAPQGRVRFSWTCEKDGSGPATIHLQWAESGGPPVQASPRRGFGTRLIERIFDYELGGDAILSFAADGLQLRATFHAA